jgi:hypothetical protein
VFYFCQAVDFCFALSVQKKAKREEEKRSCEGEKK